VLLLTEPLENATLQRATYKAPYNLEFLEVVQEVVVAKLSSKLMAVAAANAPLPKYDIKGGTAVKAVEAPFAAGPLKTWNAGGSPTAKNISLTSLIV